MDVSDSHVSACSITEWYPNFLHHTFRSEMLPLPPGFSEFLTQDGVFLPDSSNAMPRRHSIDSFAVEGVDYTSWSDSHSSSSGGTCDSSSSSVVHHGIDVREFAGFQTLIDGAIVRLGGKVLPKLNWSAPKDAWWVTSSQTTACTTSDEVFLLLQSSDRIAHDVCHAYDSFSSSSGGDLSARDGTAARGSIPALTMVLRQWHTFVPGREFRCFVHHCKVVGISQRDVTQRFDLLSAAMNAVREAILLFHCQHIEAVFPLDDYTYDVYVTEANVVRLVDFNPAGGVTALLLFDSWTELGFDGPSATSEGRHTPCLHPSKATTSEKNDTCSEDCSLESPVSTAHLPLGALSIAVTDEDCSSKTRSRRTVESQDRVHYGNRTESRSSSGGRGSSCHAHEPPPVVDFRIVTEAVVMRSAAGGYGVPYDFVDDGANAAVEDFARAYHRSQHVVP